MKSKFSIFILLCVLLIFLLVACGGNIPVTTSVTEPTFTQLAEDIQPTATIIPTTTVIATSTPDSFIAACKAEPAAFTNVGLGLPRPTYKLPSIGTVKTIVLFADFEDAPASQTPEEVFALISPDAENFYSDISYGNMAYILEPHFVWLRLGQPSSHYGQGLRSYEGHLEFIQDAVNLADADVDFSTAASVIVVVPPQASEVPFGPALGANQGEGYTADGRTFENGVTSGADLLGWGFLWLNHETGHIMSLPDLYAYNYDPSNYEDQHRFVGGFGLMGFISGNAPEYFAFERWQLGWLKDSQIICQQAADQTTTLTAIETDGGTKAIIVPLNGTKLLVVESRRRIGYDQKLVKEGALVYTVDTSIYSGEGPIVVYPILENDPYRDQSPLAAGESFTVEGVTVTVIESTDEGDTVQVAITK
ncbi:MAG: hypothetical protein H7Y59_19970 [Anaerolineales bacterium]|nr:hypothetical protein [Anaerolineales bacterium]